MLGYFLISILSMLSILVIFALSIKRLYGILILLIKLYLNLSTITIWFLKLLSITHLLVSNSNEIMITFFLLNTFLKDSGLLEIGKWNLLLLIFKVFIDSFRVLKRPVQCNKRFLLNKVNKLYLKILFQALKAKNIFFFILR